MGGYVIIKALAQKQKQFMSKPKFKKLLFVNKVAAVIAIGAVLSVATLGYGKVRADQFDAQIQALQQQNAGAQAQADSLAAVASSYQDAINRLQVQISSLQQNIVATQTKSDGVKNQIADAQVQLAQQKKTLGENIKTMYLEGKISTIEILASSKNLSDFIDKQQYRNSVQSKVKTTVDKINSLKVELEQQQRELDSLIADLQTQQRQLYTKQDQQNQMLAYTEGQKSAYDQQISANSSKISELRRQQIIANSRNVIGLTTYGGSCGGGYPGAAAGPFGTWGCNYAKDNTYDNWGMGNRECVSYTAWRVASSGRNMPYWGGFGDANQWPGNARAEGIPVDNGGNARVGDVAISMAGTWGHAMYVEAVNGDGTVTVSQYNQDFQGNYSVNTRSMSSLYFIHF
ncbi:MAG: hypothetical protein JWO96_341 [Candidatus Saccharibacteria bacterium]|nr:hypothetical protein [Candidatus Saccharibacteria bacterium]